jgi:DNA-binding beta-propeller fold protein YncE
LRTLPFSAEVPLNGFVVAPDGSRLYAGDEVVDVAANRLLSTRMPVSIETGSSWAGAPVPGGPAISRDGRVIYCQNAILAVDTTTGTATDTGLYGYFMSGVAVNPAGTLLLVSEYSYGGGRLKIADLPALQAQTVVGGLGDFSGEIGFVGDNAIVSCSGNPAWGGGGISVISLASRTVISSKLLPLADNFAVSDQGEILAAAGQSDDVQGSRLGLDVFTLSPEGELLRSRTFFFGVNRFVSSFGKPSYDQIRRIVYKPPIIAR